VLLAYSYIRFSHPAQAEGDSLVRQTERAAEFARRHGLTLDTSLTLRDLGVSAFRGRNAAVGNLRVFLDAIGNGTVAAGSTLIVESWDRISRQGIDEGYDLVKKILKAGVRIATLSPERLFDREATKSLSKGALEIQLILERAAEESQTKSDRVGAAWRRKKAEAGKRIVTSMTPGWVVRDNDRLTLDPKKAATVRRVFALAREGYGIGRIAKKLNAEKVPLIGRTSFRGRPLLWSVNVVYGLLTNRAVIGEYQPCVGSRGPERKPAGDPVPDYYPAVISHEEFNAVRGILSTRAAVGRGRRGKHVNLFAGLLKDARTGGSLTSKHVGNRAPVLIPVETRTTTGGTRTSFGLRQFEESLRAELAEVQVKDIAPSSGTATQRESLEADLADLDTLATKWRAKMDIPAIVDTVAAKLDEISQKRKMLAADLAALEVEAANPIGESWTQARATGKALAVDNSDEARERYRTAVRRAVESVWVLIMPYNGEQKRATVRVAAVQVWFRTGAHRDYMIGYKPGRGRQVGETLKPRSLYFPGTPGDPDLRDPKQAAELERALASVDINALFADPGASRKSARKPQPKGKAG
jgi:DNA invertase Pin-like site-specific DNA recombinase